MTETADADFYRRGCDTLLASWMAYGRSATDATVRRLQGVAAAIFPHKPERGVYNNALLALGLGVPARTHVLAGDSAASSDTSHRCDRRTPELCQRTGPSSPLHPTFHSSRRACGVSSFSRPRAAHHLSDSSSP